MWDLATINRMNAESSKHQAPRVYEPLVQAAENLIKSAKTLPGGPSSAVVAQLARALVDAFPASITQSTKRYRIRVEVLP